MLLSIYPSFHSQISFCEILQPAIELAEKGFPVAPITAHHWEKGLPDLYSPGNTHGQDLLLGGRAPRAGEIMKMPQLAKTFKVKNKHAVDYSYRLQL